MFTFRATVFVLTGLILSTAGTAWAQRARKPNAAPLPAEAARAQDAPRAQREQPKDGTTMNGRLGALDAENRHITLVISNRTDGELEVVLAVAKDAVILQDDVKTKLEDLKKGNSATVKVVEKIAVSITVEGGTRRAKFKSINPERNTITVIAGRGDTLQTYHLLKTTKVTMEGGKAATVQDLKVDSEILLTLSALGDGCVIRIQPAPPMEKKRGE